MRAFVIFLLGVGLLVVSTKTLAEIIHLKNGRTISADHVRQDGAHLEYEIGEESFAILNSSVDHVEAGNLTGTRSNEFGRDTPEHSSIYAAGKGGKQY